MGAILTSNLARFNNETHAEFHENIKRTIEKATIEIIGVEPNLYSKYITAYSNELECLNIVRKSELTDKILGQDKIRDNIFRGLWDAIKSYRNHFELDYRIAANKLWNILQHYGNIAGKTLDAQTAAVSDIIREFSKPELAQAITFLQLDEWIIKMEEENTKFRNLMTERYNEQTGKTTFRMKTARKETDKYYRGIVMTLEAINLSDIRKQDTEFNIFIAELNAVIKRFKDILSQEHGRKNKI